ncbi:DUF721 domain-containing protein [Palleronia sp.]|uniref:DUF721 domain-containing protein n=1 Tax=Palleronia sp. TaxID=1940284 RepID=UPI0035C7D872
MNQSQTPYRRKFRKGPVRAATLVERDIRRVGESRGFAVSRLLTHWEEVAGHEMAAICRPVDVSFSRGGMGATLTVLTTGAQAPMLQMQVETLRRKVNACYGYDAIRRIHITQTAPSGFGPQAPARTEVAAQPVDPVARSEAASVTDPDLRAALERLGTNVRSDRFRKGHP